MISENPCYYQDVSDGMEYLQRFFGVVEATL